MSDIQEACRAWLTQMRLGAPQQGLDLTYDLYDQRIVAQKRKEIGTWVLATV